MSRPLFLDDGLDLAGLHAVAVERRPLALGEAARARMAESSDTLARLVGERRRIYGVTTGYGPLARHYVTPEQAATLQRNLIYHLATGVGRPYSPVHTRAIMAARASSLARGRSGIGAATFDLLLRCLEADLLPVVPEMGTVGASGDLTPLAHIALVLIGEGEAMWRGERMPAAAALRAAGLAPAALGHKEGLALVNGTSAMTGVAAVNAVRARRAGWLALRLAALHAEVMGGHAEAWDPRFGQARPHPGQRLAHAALGRLSAGTARLQAQIQPPPRLPDDPDRDGVFADRILPQDPYTIRCAPQLLGAVFDVMDFHDRTVEIELNSVTDNPLVFAEDGAVLHGGNFFGQHVAFASDALCSATIQIVVHAERCLARLCDPAANGGLPAFLQQGPVGLNSGLMGAQVTASALVAELRTKAVPASIQSIPTNNANQDVVPLGTIAARKTSECLDLCWLVLAIHGLALAQACELRGGLGSDGAGFSPQGRRLAERIRATVGFLDRDRPLSAEIQALAADLEATDWSAV
ncbi:MAG TPA: aromatic amino acid ammonia-lyase [Alphaproteobacteria bacterium]|nr:aromatic amino acid ammonia-lyase [Alphaproteobacteria bacterium]